ncbi:hypothetical protein EDB81DRAFT_767811 [Dactylonectria macrodidyma]|uniref:Hydrophobin n=1 Tax=Dactylonectria macrodidyma TaxID=307937 RepID=A0A9P9D904_9HYPO|nr:hypothetical protein EDB81DRAFT_893130 [Dactylonectria macrodidyma]KAH7114652.1 hypothetical protein EDB81DRAFT_767802 [Dactylonectria macrodidyma]KAH7114663.1 hypothetical protein EDB81DRAFT_767811 [Dactylonectria macrodidyma]
MQVTSIVALLIAATGALAAPGGYKPNKPNKPSKPAPPVVQQITCSGGSPYCCNAEANGGEDSFASGGGDIYFKCSDMTNNCNSITVCCNNNGEDAEQTCAAFGNAKVIFD